MRRRGCGAGGGRGACRPIRLAPEAAPRARGVAPRDRAQGARATPRARIAFDPRDRQTARGSLRLRGRGRGHIRASWRGTGGPGAAPRIGRRGGCRHYALQLSASRPRIRDRPAARRRRDRRVQAAAAKSPVEPRARAPVCGAAERCDQSGDRWCGGCRSTHRPSHRHARELHRLIAGRLPAASGRPRQAARLGDGIARCVHRVPGRGSGAGRSEPLPGPA